MSANLPILWSDKKNSPELKAFLAQFGAEYCFSAEEMNQLRDAVNEMSIIQQSTFKGTAEPTGTPSGTGNRYWVAVTPGTYTNFGGVVVTANSLAIISVTAAGVFSVSQIALNLSTYLKIVDGNKINPWTAKAYLSGDQVNYLGKDWVSNAATTAGDVPGTSSKWVDRLTSKINVSDVINSLDSTETTKPLSASQGKFLNEKNIKIATWTEIAFASGDQVNYLGKDWVSNTATLASDVPGTSSKWVDRLTSKINVSDVINSLDSTENTKPLSASQGKFLNEKNIKIATWTAIAFASGNQVNYLGKDWVSNTATLASDVPGTSSKWVDRLTSKINVSDVINSLDSTETTKPLSAAQGKFLNEKNIKIATWTAIAFASGDQVNYLGKDWVSNAATVAGDVPGISAKWVIRLTAYENKADLIPGKNLFNYLGIDTTIGSFLTNTNSLSVNSGYSYTGYIPITVGLAYYCNKFNYNGGAYYHWYDANKTFISSSNTLGTVAPTGAAYLRYSLNINTGFSTVQIEAGSIATTFEAYTPVVKSNQLDLSLYSKTTEIPAVVTPLILNKADLVVGKNIFNKDTRTVGKYIENTGFIAISASYDCSDYIPVIPLNQYKSSTNMRFVAFYDANKILVSGGISANTTTFTTLSNVYYVIISLAVSETNYSTFQLELGTTSTTFEAYKKTVPTSNLDLSLYPKNTDIPELVTPLISNKANLVVGKNIFNYLGGDTTIGSFLTNSNSLSVNSGYSFTGYIPITVGLAYYCNKFNYNGGAYYHWYDTNKTFISSSNVLGTVAPVGAAYLRYSLNINTGFSTVQIEVGSVATNYTPYSLTILDINLPDTVQRKTDSIILADGSVTESKTTFFELSKNLFNPNDASLGYYVLYSNGVLSANAGYNATGFIPVTTGQNYTMSYKHQIAWYDINKVYISGSSSTDFIKTQLAPTGAAYLRCSINIASYSTFQVELGSSQTSYIGYQYIFKQKYIDKYFTELNLAKYDSILGNDGKIVSQSNLAANTIIEVIDFPFHIKKGISMSIYADLTTVGTISYGKGYAKYRGEYFSIDATNIYQYSDSTLILTKPHGLTINTFIKSSFSVDDSGVANFILQSKTGYFKTTFQMLFEMNYEPFIRAGTQAITNVKLTCTSKEFRQPVWAFGDSYFGINSARWPGTMKTFGYFNFLINGLAGQGSGGAYNDLLRCLNYGTPRYIIWCLGMNDSDSDYTSTLELLKSLCISKSIKLILSTIPTVPTRYKEVIKTTVLTSGYRYIDFYKAVGANNSGVWHSDYLDADGVHPTQLGADALATQILIDFPELMQYGKNL